MNLSEETQALCALFFGLDERQRMAFLREVSVRLANAPADRAELAEDTPKKEADAVNSLKPPNSSANSDKEWRAEIFAMEMKALTPPESFPRMRRLDSLDLDVNSKRRALALARVIKADKVVDPFRVMDIVETEDPYLDSKWKANNAAENLRRLGFLACKKLSHRVSRTKVYWRNPKWK